MRWDKVNVVDVEANVVYFFESGYRDWIYFLSSICFGLWKSVVEKLEFGLVLLLDLVVEKWVRIITGLRCGWWLFGELVSVHFAVSVWKDHP